MQLLTQNDDDVNFLFGKQECICIYCLDPKMNDTTIHYEMLRSLFQMCVIRVKYNPPFHHIVYFAGNPIMTDLCTMLQDEDYPKAENNRTDIHAIFFIKVLFFF